MHPLIAATAGLLAATLLATGCAPSRASAPRAIPSATPSPALATPGQPAPGPSVAWNALTRRVDLDGGFDLSDCEGEAPFLCVRRDGTAVGVIELMSYPVASVPELTRDLARGEEEALLGHVTRFLRSVRDDRARGCPPGYRVDGIDPALLRSRDGVRLVRYGFSATTSAGQPAERMVQYAGITGGELVLLVASGIDDGGCLSREGEFTTEVLSAFEPTLHELMQRSVAPRPVRRG